MSDMEALLRLPHPGVSMHDVRAAMGGKHIGRLLDAAVRPTIVQTHRRRGRLVAPMLLSAAPPPTQRAVLFVIDADAATLTPARVAAFARAFLRDATDAWARQLACTLLARVQPLVVVAAADDAAAHASPSPSLLLSPPSSRVLNRSQRRLAAAMRGNRVGGGGGGGGGGARVPLFAYSTHAWLLSPAAVAVADADAEIVPAAASSSSPSLPSSVATSPLPADATATTAVVADVDDDDGGVLTPSKKRRRDDDDDDGDGDGVSGAGDVAVVAPLPSSASASASTSTTAAVIDATAAGGTAPVAAAAAAVSVARTPFLLRELGAPLYRRARRLRALLRRITANRAAALQRMHIDVSAYHSNEALAAAATAAADVDDDDGGDGGGGDGNDDARALLQSLSLLLTPTLQSRQFTLLLRFLRLDTLADETLLLVTRFLLVLPDAAAAGSGGGGGGGGGGGDSLLGSESSLSHSKVVLFLRLCLAPKAAALTKAASRVFLSTLLSTAATHAKATVHGFLLPLIGGDAARLHPVGKAMCDAAATQNAHVGGGGGGGDDALLHALEATGDDDSGGGGGAPPSASLSAPQCEVINKVVDCLAAPPKVANSGGGGGVSAAAAALLLTLLRDLCVYTVDGCPRIGGDGGGAASPRLRWNDYTVKVAQNLLSHKTGALPLERVAAAHADAPLPPLVVRCFAAVVAQTADGVEAAAAATAVRRKSPEKERKRQKRAAKTAKGKGGGGGAGKKEKPMHASLPFSTLVFTFIQKYATAARAHKPDLHRVVEQLTSFMQKAALKALKKL
jgi:hypothetical protein